MTNPSLDWNELADGKPFIVDLGFSPDVSEQLPDAEVKQLGRFGAFMPVPNQNRHQIVEVSADLGYLQKQYNVPDDRVLRAGLPAPASPA